MRRGSAMAITSRGATSPPRDGGTWRTLVRNDLPPRRCRDTVSGPNCAGARRKTPEWWASSVAGGLPVVLGLFLHLDDYTLDTAEASCDEAAKFGHRLEAAEGHTFLLVPNPIDREGTDEAPGCLALGEFESDLPSLRVLWKAEEEGASRVAEAPQSGCDPQLQRGQAIQSMAKLLGAGIVQVLKFVEEVEDPPEDSVVTREGVIVRLQSSGVLHGRCLLSLWLSMTRRRDPRGKEVGRKDVRSTPEGLPCGRPPLGYKAAKTWASHNERRPPELKDSLRE